MKELKRIPIFDKIQSYKKKLAMGGAMFALLLLLLVFLSPKSTTKNYPTALPSPTPITNPNQSIKFPMQIISISPQEDLNRIDFPIKPIEVSFNKMVSASDLKVKTEPQTKLYIDNKPTDPTTIIISPDPIWTEGITTVTILAGSKAIDGSVFKTDVSLKINAQFPTEEESVD